MLVDGKIHYPSEYKLNQSVLFVSELNQPILSRFGWLLRVNSHQSQIMLCKHLVERLYQFGVDFVETANQAITFPRYWCSRLSCYKRNNLFQHTIKLHLKRQPKENAQFGVRTNVQSENKNEGDS